MTAAIHNPAASAGNEADKKWGYVFGCDGLMSARQAADFLSVSDRSLDRMAAHGDIRKGVMPRNGHRAFCKRSVVEFAQGLEK